MEPHDTRRASESFIHPSGSSQKYSPRRSSVASRPVGLQQALPLPFEDASFSDDLQLRSLDRNRRTSSYWSQPSLVNSDGTRSSISSGSMGLPTPGLDAGMQLGTSAVPAPQYSPVDRTFGPLEGHSKAQEMPWWQQGPVSPLRAGMMTAAIPEEPEPVAPEFATTFSSFSMVPHLPSGTTQSSRSTPMIPFGFDDPRSPPQWQAPAAYPPALPLISPSTTHGYDTDMGLFGAEMPPLQPPNAVPLGPYGASPDAPSLFDSPLIPFTSPPFSAAATDTPSLSSLMFENLALDRSVSQVPTLAHSAPPGISQALFGASSPPPPASLHPQRDLSTNVFTPFELEGGQGQGYFSLSTGAAPLGPPISLGQQAASIPVPSTSGHRTTDHRLPIVQRYLATPNRLELGERVAVITSPRLPNKTLSATQRFISPGIGLQLLGSSWWRTQVMVGQPHVGVSLALEGSDDLAVDLDCRTDKGRPCIPPFADPPPERDIGASIDYGERAADEDIVAGNALVHKFNVVGEDVALADHAVRAQVSISAPSKFGQGPQFADLLSTEVDLRGQRTRARSSLPPAFAELQRGSLHHGDFVVLSAAPATSSKSIVSQPNRYLVSQGQGPVMAARDWQELGGVTPQPTGSKTSDQLFTLRTDRHETFAIWLVDPLAVRPEVWSTPESSPHFYHPTNPPLGVLPWNVAASAPIYYNQLVVLQSTISGQCSPVMVIRDVQQGKTSVTALGGGKGDFDTLGACAAGESPGIMISANARIALEIYASPHAAAITVEGTGSAAEGYEGSGTFLASENDGVGAMLYHTPRTVTSVLSSPPLAPLSSSPARRSKSALAEASGVERSPRGSMRAPSRARTLKRSTSIAVGAPMEWTQAIDDRAVWQCHAMDIARYAFCPAPGNGGLADAFIDPPIVLSIGAMSHADFAVEAASSPLDPEDHEEERMLMLKGLHLSAAYSLWLGTTPVARVIRLSDERMICPQPSAEACRQPLLLVRDDGAIFRQAIPFPAHAT